MKLLSALVALCLFGIGYSTHCDAGPLGNVQEIVEICDGSDGPFTANVVGGHPETIYTLDLLGGQSVFVETCSSSFDTGLSFWESISDAGNFLVGLLACNDDSCGLQSRLTFTAPSDGTYYLRCGGFGLSSGNCIMNVQYDGFGCDRDNDGVLDAQDNCPDTSNADQSDIDDDGVGDVCDDDKDGDGVANDQDNCPDVANADQEDFENNGVGDACEPNPWIAGQPCAGLWECEDYHHCSEFVCELCPPDNTGCGETAKRCYKRADHLYEDASITECDNGAACTLPTCNLDALCDYKLLYLPRYEKACEDGNPCTEDTCANGQCSYAPTNEGQTCHVTGTCSAGQCVH